MYANQLSIEAVSEMRPQPKNPEDQARWVYQDKVWRILYGFWADDLQRHIQRQVGAIRREAWKCPDLSANFYRTAWDALARTYDQPPVVSNVTDNGLAAVVSAAGLWPMMQSVQRDTFGLREMLVRVDWAQTFGGVELVYRPVWPQYVTALADPDRPDVPVKLCEARKRTINGKIQWTWDIFDIREGMETWCIHGARGEDLTEAVLGVPAADLYGELYPFRYATGEAFVPYAMYHASKGGHGLWDTYSTLEMVEGTLNVGVLYSYLLHIIRNVAYKQKYTVDLILGGTSYTDADDDGEGLTQITTDPARVLMFSSIPEAAGQPQIGQWDETADPQKLIETIKQYERRLSAMAGINPADLMRTAGDPRSGYALAVSRDAQREIQKRIEPCQRAGDLDLLAKSAAVLRINGGAVYPETGYSIEYHGIPLSLEERRAMLDELQTEMDLGLVSRVDAYMRRNPGTSEAEARAALTEIQRVNAAYSATTDAEQRDSLDWDVEHNTITPVEMVQIRRPGATVDQAMSVLVDAEVERRQIASMVGQRLTALGLAEAAPESAVELAPTDLAAIITANEARAQEGLGPIEGGQETIAAFKAQAAVVPTDDGE